MHSKKNWLWSTLGHFKKAVNYSLEDNDQQNLDDIILSYTSERQAKRQTVTVRTAWSSEQLETRNILEDSRKSNNEITLSDGRVYDINDINDPIKHNCKGRPLSNEWKVIMNQIILLQALVNHRKKTCKITVIWIMGKSVIYVIKRDIMLQDVLTENKQYQL